jgi:hypothetical protein
MSLITFIGFDITFTSCSSTNSPLPLPLDEIEFQPPLTKTLGNPKMNDLKKLLNPKGHSWLDSIKLPEVIKLGEPKVIPFIDNVRTLGKPELVPFIQDDTVYCFSDHSVNLIGKTPVKVKEPVKRKIKPRIIMLGEPEKLTSYQAQTLENSLTNLKYFNQDQGLPATLIQCMCLDSYGNVWIGTDGGLCKFDGKEWWIYTIKQGLSNNHIISLIKSSMGNLIVATEGGLNILDLKKNIIKSYTTKQGLSSNNITCVYESREGDILLATFGGGLNVLHLNNPKENTNVLGNLTIYDKDQGLSNNLVYCVLEDRMGNIIMGTYNGGLNVINKNNQILKRYSTSEGLCDNKITSIKETKNGDIIIGAVRNGLNILNCEALNDKETKIQHIKHYGTKQGLSSNAILSILENHDDGIIMIGTISEGLKVLDLKNQNIINYDNENGLSSNNVLSLLETREGNILIGTEGGGLHILNQSSPNIKHYNNVNILNKYSVWSVLESREGYLLTGTYKGGLCLIDEKDKIIKHYSTRQGLSSNLISCLLESRDGNLIIGCKGGGVDIINNISRTIKHYGEEQGLSNNFVSSICISREGKLVIGTDLGGLNILDPNPIPLSGKKHKVNKHSIVKYLENSSITSIHERTDGTFLIGTKDEGLKILDTKNQWLKNYSILEGLNCNAILCLFENQKGEILIGTNGGGLNIMDSRKRIIKHYSIEQGLPNSQITSIVVDSLENIWLGTGKGLCKMVLKNNNYVVQKVFDKREGLKSADFNPNALIYTAKSEFWAGIGNTFTKFSHCDIIDTLRPIINITSVDVMGKKSFWYTEKRVLSNLDINDTIWSSTQDKFYLNKSLIVDTTFFVKNNITYSGVTNDIYHLPKDLILPYYNNHLTFNFTANYISANADRVRYRYILDGFDEEWSQITANSKVDYRNIPPGRYNFKVAARGVNGRWSAPVEFSFNVLAPWYKTNLAYLVYLISLLSTFYIFLYFRQKNLKKFSKQIIKIQEEEKLRISRDLHDDLGQELSFLKMNEDVKNKAAIDRIIQKVRTISYNLKPIKLLDASIKELLEDLLKSAENSSVFFSYEIENIRINDVDIKINLYRIIQEAINNIIKHSHAENARVTLSKKEKNIVVEIMDDGIGINEVDISKINSVGIASMKERSNIINAKFTIAPRSKGLLIKLEFKL